MRITVEHDNGTVETFQHVVDCYLAVRRIVPVMKDNGGMGTVSDSKSYSWGSNLRETAKELAQSLLEIQDTLTHMRRSDGSST